MIIVITIISPLDIQRKAMEKPWVSCWNPRKWAAPLNHSAGTQSLSRSWPQSTLRGNDSSRGAAGGHEVAPISLRLMLVVTIVFMDIYGFLKTIYAFIKQLNKETYCNLGWANCMTL